MLTEEQGILLVKLATRAIKGEMTIWQGVWILGYFAYTSLIGANIYELPLPVDGVAMFGFAMGILFASGSVIGLTKFMGILFENLKPEGEKSIQKALTAIEKDIMKLGKKYFFVKLKSDYERASKPTIVNELD